MFSAKLNLIIKLIKSSVERLILVVAVTSSWCQGCFPGRVQFYVQNCDPFTSVDRKNSQSVLGNLESVPSVHLLSAKIFCALLSLERIYNEKIEFENCSYVVTYKTFFLKLHEKVIQLPVCVVLKIHAVTPSTENLADISNFRVQYFLIFFRDIDSKSTVKIEEVIEVVSKSVQRLY